MADPFGRNAGKVTIKNGKTSKGQRNILARAIRYADKVHAPYRAKIALLTAIIQESEAYNLSTASADGYGSYGVLQGLERYHSRKNLMNPEYQFGVFLGQNKKYPKGFTGKGNAIQLAKSGMSAGDIAQAVEGSAYPERYATTVGEAQRINRLYKTGGGATASGGHPGATSTSTPTVKASPAIADAGAANLTALWEYAKNKKKGAKLTDLYSTLQGNNSAAAASSASAASSMPKVAKVVKATGGGSSLPRKGKGKGKASDVYELFYDPQGGWKFGASIGAINDHTDHVHVAAGEGRTVYIGRQARKMGLRVAENKHFSGSTPTGGHAPNSYHYKNEAIDVSGSAAQMAAFARWVRRTYNLAHR
jgi:hypothetical protein